MRGFDPDFDDAQWTLNWAAVPIIPVQPGRHPQGYQLIERRLVRASIFGKTYEAREPFVVRALLDDTGRLWMSDTPQERMMMYNNAQRTRGRVLVGGLGLAMYPQYAAERASSFTIVECSRAVIDSVGPVLQESLGGRRPPVPYAIAHGRIEEWLDSAAAGERFDTIFLDTWDTLDAAALPAINRLRNRCLPHLAAGGRILLWGYRWIVRLFVEACRQVLILPPEQRRPWLESLNQPQAAALLAGVLDRFDGQVVQDLPAALRWCTQRASCLD
jgi:hypothetical protein